MFNPVSAQGQLERWTQFVTDPRGRIPTGFSTFDSLLRKGGLAVGDFAILGGRTSTRKTTVTLNMVAHALNNNIAVGLVGLDEAFPQYVGKLMSAATGLSVENLEEKWDSNDRPFYEDMYMRLAAGFTMGEGRRPDTNDLSVWLAAADPRPQLVFVDFSSRLHRGQYDGQETQRMNRLVENLSEWTKAEEISCVCLHQAKRADEGARNDYQGDTPMGLSDLKHAGEDYADLVMCTYRPALNRYGRMSRDAAMQFKGDYFDEEKWRMAQGLVRKYQNSTFLQLIKNRPGVALAEQGIELVSLGDSMKLQERERSMESEQAYG